MTNYTLGMSEEKWSALKKTLTMPDEIAVSKRHGADNTIDTDTSDNSLDIVLDIIHLDVAQGESTLILLSCPNKQSVKGESIILMSILIDGGLASDGGGLVARALRSYNIRPLNAAVISHFDADHASGIFRIIEEARYRNGAEMLKAAQAELELAVVQVNSAAEKLKCAKDNSATQKKTLRRLEKNLQVAREQQAEAEGLVKDFEYFAANQDETGEYPATATSRGWKSVQIENVFAPGAGSLWSRLEEECNSVELKPKAIKRGDTLTLACSADKGKFKMTCLAVDGAAGSVKSRIADENENKNSIAWLVEFGAHRYYTAGDLPAEVEDTLIAKLSNLTAIKCGHHGSQYSTSKKLLDASKPRLAFISAGKNDGYGHPHSNTMLRLWKSPDMQAIFATNSYFVRPLLHQNYEIVARTELQHSLDRAARLMNNIKVPSLTAAADAVPSTLHMIDDMGKFKDEWELFRTELTSLAEKFGATNPFPGKDVQDTAKQKIHSFDRLLVDHGRVIYSLAQGVKSNDKKTKSVMVDVQEESKPIRANLRAAATLVEELAEESDCRKQVAKSPKAFITGTPQSLGNATLRIKLDDLDMVDRLCFVGFEANGRWMPFCLAKSAVANASSESTPSRAALTIDTSSLNILSLDALEVSPPITPGEYAEFLEIRKERQAWRPGIPSSSFGPSTPVEPPVAAAASNSSTLATAPVATGHGWAPMVVDKEEEYYEVEEKESYLGRSHYPASHDPSSIRSDADSSARPAASMPASSHLTSSSPSAMTSPSTTAGSSSLPTPTQGAASAAPTAGKKRGNSKIEDENSSKKAGESLAKSGKLSDSDQPRKTKP